MIAGLASEVSQVRGCCLKREKAHVTCYITAGVSGPDLVQVGWPNWSYTLFFILARSFGDLVAISLLFWWGLVLTFKAPWLLYCHPPLPIWHLDTVHDDSVSCSVLQGFGNSKLAVLLMSWPPIRLLLLLLLPGPRSPGR